MNKKPGIKGERTNLREIIQEMEWRWVRGCPSRFACLITLLGTVGIYWLGEKYSAFDLKMVSILVSLLFCYFVTKRAFCKIQQIYLEYIKDLTKEMEEIDESLSNLEKEWDQLIQENMEKEE